MKRTHIAFWVGLALVTILVLVLLDAILLPFVIGFAIAYFLDPAADRLEAWGFPRGLAAAVVLFAFILLLLTIGLAFWPILASQGAGFVRNLPGLIDQAVDTLLPWVDNLMARVAAVTGEHSVQAEDALASLADQAGQWMLGVASGVLDRGMALFNLLAILFVMPVVAFFLLRDWDVIVAKIDSWLPRAHAPAIRERAREIDHVLSGYLRGQALVAMIIAVLYATGWGILGLRYALLLALVAGVLSFVPYVGAAITVALAMAIGIGQFWPDYLQVGLVFGVYIIVQAVESNFITPNLVGDRVGLSPLWIIFAMMAGGTLLGILGILLAVPTAAIIGVLLRAGLRRYKSSRLYDPDAEQQTEAIE